MTNAQTICLPSGRSASQYRGGKAEAVLGGSLAQAVFFVEDATKDILFLLEEVERLGRSPTTTTKTMGWRDIRSASRDGSEVLVWNGRRRHVAHFDRIEGERVSSFKTTTKRLIVAPPPTHWSPLPTEPATAVPTKTQVSLAEMVKRAEVYLAAMTEEERQAMWQAQRESMVRAMTTGCEHGVLDFEDCPQCRNPAPAPQMTVTAEEHNAAFDPANDALGGAFKDGFREGWLFAKDPGFDDREELEAEYPRAVDIAPSECWDAYRYHYFAILPLAAIPGGGETAPSPAPLTDIDAIMEQVQVFASTYSLAGGRFDDGTKFRQSEDEKAELRRMIEAATQAPAPQVVG